MDLDSQEISLAREIDFHPDVVGVIKRRVNTGLDRLSQIAEDGSSRPADGLSFRVRDGEEAEAVMNSLREPLASRGYRAFWSERHEPNGMKETDEVAVLKTTDPYAMIRLRRSDGANYDVFTDDILDRLNAWREVCDFDIVGASRDWVALQFSRLPERICAFAEEVYLFCSDSVSQGVGFTQINDRSKIAAARALCPEPMSESVRQKLAEGPGGISLPPELGEFLADLHNEVETGIKLLAAEMKRSGSLFLWWD